MRYIIADKATPKTGGVSNRAYATAAPRCLSYFLLSRGQQPAPPNFLSPHAYCLVPIACFARNTLHLDLLLPGVIKTTSPKAIQSNIKSSMETCPERSRMDRQSYFATQAGSLGSVLQHISQLLPIPAQSTIS